MSIENRIAKAERDLAERDYENALLQVLVAVAATARKRYPNETDRNAFESFLKDDFGRKIQPNISIRGGYIKVAFVDRTETLEHILYKFVRCNLMHEAGIPPEITFLPIDGFHLAPRGTTLEIGYGVIEILIRIVKEAPENATLFPA